MAVTPRDIVDKVFTKSFRGYDEEEVDLFLDDIIKELESKNNEIRSQYARISELMARLNAASQVMPSGLGASQEAQEFLTNANMKARVIVSQAEQYAQKLRSQAEDASRQSLAKAQADANSLLEQARRDAKLIVQKAQREAIGFSGSANAKSVRERFGGKPDAPFDMPFDLDAPSFDVFTNPPEFSEPLPELAQGVSGFAQGLSGVAQALPELSQSLPELVVSERLPDIIELPELFINTPDASRETLALLPPFDPAWEVLALAPAFARPYAPLPPLPPGSACDDAYEGEDPLGDWGQDELTSSLAKLGFDI